MSAPYPQPVASDYPYQRTSRVDLGVIRDVLAVVLVLVGLAGLTVAAFTYDWRLGLAALSASSIAVGVYLGYER